MTDRTALLCALLLDMVFVRLPAGEIRGGSDERLGHLSGLRPVPAPRLEHGADPPPAGGHAAGARTPALT